MNTSKVEYFLKAIICFPKQEWVQNVDERFQA
jgi:hypothetical protein